MKLPFMTRKKHESVVARLHKGYGDWLRNSKKMHKIREYELRTGLRQVLHKFATVGLCCSENDYTSWKLVLDFDPRPILFSLEKGKDRLVIEQIAEEFKLRVIEELSLLDVQYPDDLGLEK